MSDNNPTQPAPLLRDNGVPLVRRTAPHRPLAPSQALTSMQEQRVAKIIEKAQAPLLARIAELEKKIGASAAAPTPAVVPPTPAVEQKPAPAKPAPASIPLPTANAEISEEAQKLIDRAKSPDLRKALTAVAKRDVPEEVKLKQMEAALKKHQPES